MVDLTENEFKQLKREHYAAWRDLYNLPHEQREKLLREMYPAMYNEKGQLKQKWYD